MMIAIAALALASLHDLPALAIVETTKETFSGWTEGERKEVVLVSDDTGATCRGRIADGILRCSDGRTGLVRFQESYLGYMGRGTLDGEDLTVTVG